LPAVKLADPKKISLKREEIKVTDEQIEKIIEEIDKIKQEGLIKDTDILNIAEDTTMTVAEAVSYIDDTTTKPVDYKAGLSCDKVGP
jgi:FKBP-type peptidyl-prolyl cis-trans isomerase (trigger factor)